MRGNERYWCIRVEPDLLHLEPEGDFGAQVFHSFADMTRDARPRPGDRASLFQARIAGSV